MSIKPRTVDGYIVTNAKEDKFLCEILPTGCKKPRLVFMDASNEWCAELFHSYEEAEEKAAYYFRNNEKFLYCIKKKTITII